MTTTDRTAPARHRGRTPIALHCSRAAGFAIWAALILAVVAVIAGWRDPATITAIIVMLTLGALAALASRLTITGQTLDSAVDRLLGRDRDR